MDGRTGTVRALNVDHDKRGQKGTILGGFAQPVTAKFLLTPYQSQSGK